MRQSLRNPLPFLEGLFQCDWCQNLGRAVNRPAAVIASWDDAVLWSEDKEMDNLMLEYANRVRDEVQAVDRSLYNKWNDCPRMVRPHLSAERITAKLTCGHAVEKSLIDTLSWIIMGACIEEYYADHIQLDIFRRLADWLREGHLPLGWIGDSYPSGRPVIF